MKNAPIIMAQDIRDTSTGTPGVPIRRSILFDPTTKRPVVIVSDEPDHRAALDAFLIALDNPPAVL